VGVQRQRRAHVASKHNVEQFAVAAIISGCHEHSPIQQELQRRAAQQLLHVIEHHPRKQRQRLQARSLPRNFILHCSKQNLLAPGATESY